MDDLKVLDAQLAVALARGGSCVICLSGLHKGNHLIMPPCGHIFHASCMMTETVCPTCRGPAVLAALWSPRVGWTHRTVEVFRTILSRRIDANRRRMASLAADINLCIERLPGPPITYYSHRTHPLTTDWPYPTHPLPPPPQIEAAAPPQVTCECGEFVSTLTRGTAGAVGTMVLLMSMEAAMSITESWVKWVTFFSRLFYLLVHSDDHRTVPFWPSLIGVWGVVMLLAIFACACTKLIADGFHVSFYAACAFTDVIVGIAAYHAYKCPRRCYLRY